MSESELLSKHALAEIDQWKARFPEDRQRSAVIGALHVVQHENDGYLTAELMNAVADYLDLPTIQVYEVATFYSIFQTQPVKNRNKAKSLLSVLAAGTSPANLSRWTSKRATRSFSVSGPAPRLRLTATSCSS